MVIYLATTWGFTGWWTCWYTKYSANQHGISLFWIRYSTCALDKGKSPDREVRALHLIIYTVKKIYEIPGFFWLYLPGTGKNLCWEGNCTRFLVPFKERIFPVWRRGKSLLWKVIFSWLWEVIFPYRHDQQNFREISWLATAKTLNLLSSLHSRNQTKQNFFELVAYFPA